MRNRLFLISAVAVLVSAALIRFIWMDRWERPSVCDCKVVYDQDSSVAVPAARTMVGNAYYQYTLRVARIHCLKAYADELPPGTWEDTLDPAGPKGRAFFLSRCP